METVIQGFFTVLQLENLVFLIIGVFMGIVFGALPGLTATMGLALLVPFTFTMSPASGLIMLAGIYVGAMYGDAIPAVLINTPATPAAIATTFDGFPLAQKGMARHGLVAAAFASSYGSLVANLVLSIAVFIKGLVKPERVQFFESAVERNNVLIGIVILLMYLVFLPFAGFLESSYVFYFVFNSYLADHDRLALRNLVQSLVISFVVVTASYFVFHNFLSVPLPEGAWLSD